MKNIGLHLTLLLIAAAAVTGCKAKVKETASTPASASRPDSASLPNVTSDPDVTSEPDATSMPNAKKSDAPATAELELAAPIRKEKVAVDMPAESEGGESTFPLPPEIAQTADTPKQKTQAAKAASTGESTFPLPNLEVDVEVKPSSTASSKSSFPWPEDSPKSETKGTAGAAAVSTFPLPTDTSKPKVASTVASPGESTFPWPENEASEKPAVTEQDKAKSKKRDLLAMFPQWQQAKELKGDVKSGREIYTRIGLESPFSCQACHSFDEKDAFKVDAFGLIRVGHPIFAAAHRTNTKNSGIGNAALGGNICVLHFFKGDPPGMDAQELAHLDAFLKSGGDAKHPTAQNIPYDKMAYPVPPAKLTGGDVAKGKTIAMTRCVSCHDVDDVEAKYGEVGIGLAQGDSDYLTPKELAARIRNIDDENNYYMPGFSNLVLTDQEMIDLIAWLTTSK